MFSLKNFPLSCRRIFAWLFLLFFFVSSNIHLIAVEQAVNNQSAKPAVIAGFDPIPLNGRLSFRTFTDREGLPQNAIQAMTFDRKGYLWVGTQDGAAYYNGRSWMVVNMPQRTVSNFVRAIVAASDGSIWFGRTAGGASRLKDGVWTSFDEKSGLGSARVNTILETRAADGSSILWFGTEKGVARLQGEEWTRFDETNSVLPTGELNALAETVEADGTSVIWAGTEKGLARFAKNEWRLIQTKDGLVNDFVNGIFSTKEADGRTVLWIGTSAGISRYDLRRAAGLIIKSRTAYRSIRFAHSLKL
jgi:ligand-binding sensor domain-containing protein